MNSRGFSLLELVVVVMVLGVAMAVAVPHIHASLVDAQLVGAADEFKGEFRRISAFAISHDVQTAIRFEDGPNGPTYSTYYDGNGNGVLSRDIEAGVDPRLSGPLPLQGTGPGVRVAILPGTPAPPPDRGTLDVSKPIRFGRSRMVSFSPLNTATPGTFYLAGDGGQAAVRVTGGTARVRVMLFRGGRWVLR